MSLYYRLVLLLCSRPTVLRFRCSKQHDVDTEATVCGKRSIKPSSAVRHAHGKFGYDSTIAIGHRDLKIDLNAETLLVPYMHSDSGRPARLSLPTCDAQNK